MQLSCGPLHCLNRPKTSAYAGLSRPWEVSREAVLDDWSHDVIREEWRRPRNEIVLESTTASLGYLRLWVHRQRLLLTCFFGCSKSFGILGAFSLFNIKPYSLFGCISHFLGVSVLRLNLDYRRLPTSVPLCYYYDSRHYLISL
jgi:hypothetical protein